MSRPGSDRDRDKGQGQRQRHPDWCTTRAGHHAALHLAVERQLEEMVTFLVREARVDIAREDFNGVTPVEASEKYNSPAIKKIINKEFKKQPSPGQ